MEKIQYQIRYVSFILQQPESASALLMAGVYANIHAKTISQVHIKSTIKEPELKSAMK